MTARRGRRWRGRRWRGRRRRGRWWQRESYVNCRRGSVLAPDSALYVSYREFSGCEFLPFVHAAVNKTREQKRQKAVWLLKNRYPWEMLRKTSAVETHADRRVNNEQTRRKRNVHRQGTVFDYASNSYHPCSVLRTPCSVQIGFQAATAVLHLRTRVVCTE